MKQFNIDNIPERKIVISLFLLSLLIRLIYGIYSYTINGSSNFDDDWVYIKFAHEMIKQGIFVRDISHMTPTNSGITPFYPFIIFISFNVFGITYLPLIILNALFSSLLTPIAYYLGKIVFTKKVGLFSSIWTLFYVNSIRWVPTLLKENLIHLLFALFILLLIYYLFNKNNYYVLFLISFVFILLIHTDERYSVYFIMLFLIILLNKENSLSGRIYSFIFVCTVIVIFMIPWLYRNYDVYKRPVILSVRTAQITDKYFSYKNEYNFSQEIQISDATLDSIIKGMPVYDMTLYNIIRRGISYGSIPVRYSRIEKLYIDFKELWRPFRFSNMWVSEGFRPEGKWSFSHNLSIIMTYGVLLPFFLFGIFCIIKEKNKSALVLLFIILIHTLIHITIVLSQNRYRISIDIIIIVISFYGLMNLIRLFSEKKLLDGSAS